MLQDPGRLGRIELSAPARGRASAKRRAAQRGQTTTEYVLLIAVIVIALAGISYEAVFKEGSSVRLGLAALLDEDAASSSKTNIPTAVNRGFVAKDPRNP